MNAVIALIVTLFAGLGAVVVFHWQREAVRVANDLTATWKERRDARVSTVTFAIQTFVFVAFAGVGVVLTLYALLLPGGPR